MLNVIVVNGNYRSGSTLIYNVVQRMMQGIGAHMEAFGADDARIKESILLPHSSIHVIKNHTWIPYNPPECVKCIFSTRDIYDAIYSGLVVRTKLGTDTGDWGELKNTIDTHIEREKRHRNISLAHPDRVLYLDYERFYGNNTWLISRIARFLGIRVSKGASDLIAEEFDIMRVKAKCDKLEWDEAATQFRPHHVSDTGGATGLGRRNLPPKIVNYIDGVLEC